MCKAQFDAPSKKESTGGNSGNATPSASAAAVSHSDHILPQYSGGSNCDCRHSTGVGAYNSSVLTSGWTGDGKVGGGGPPSGNQTPVIREGLGTYTYEEVLHKNNKGLQKQTSAGCPKCSDGMGRFQHQQHRQEQEKSSKPSPHEGREQWSLERAVAVWSGRREWLRVRLLRKRPRPVSSNYSSDVSHASNSNSLRNRRADSLSLPVSSNINGGISSNNGANGIGGMNEKRSTWSRWVFSRSSISNRALSSLKLLALVGVTLLLLWVLRFIITETYVRSYCFQVRAMQKSQVPRGECHIVKITRESRQGWETRGGVEGGSNGLGRAVSKWGKAEGLKFGIAVMCDYKMWPKRYTDMAIANKNAYAELHGYELIVANSDDVDKTRPAAWSKLLLLLKHLDNYDYLMFLDIDAFIMNPAFKLEWLVDVALMQQQIGGMDGWGDRNMEPDVIVTRDWNGPNSGVVLIKNSDFSRWFLKEWWDQDQFVHGKFPFNYEQRAMHYLMQPDTWRDAGLPYYADYEVIRAHTAVIDQCAMNSYLVHPWQGLLGRTKDLGPAASYVPGDFILHFAGKKGRVRLELVESYYPEAEKALKRYREKLKQDESGESPAPLGIPSKADVDFEHNRDMTVGRMRGSRSP